MRVRSITLPITGFLPARFSAVQLFTALTLNDAVGELPVFGSVRSFTTGTAPVDKEKNLMMAGGRSTLELTIGLANRGRKSIRLGAHSGGGLRSR